MIEFYNHQVDDFKNKNFGSAEQTVSTDDHKIKWDKNFGMKQIKKTI